ncbi:MAG: hypothetical protein JNL73_15145 [Anaerolineales bacterium]|nr:hypothetical protein [Anaerolineales bacterium]
MTVTRERILETLENRWGNYLATYDELPQQLQVAFLNRQGYRRFADLLAHIIAWWRDALFAVDALLVDPDFEPPNREVDGFNAAAVAEFRDQDEHTVRQTFERTRRALVDLVTRLSPEAFQTEEIVARLNIEIVGHLTEHSLFDFH